MKDTGNKMIKVGEEVEEVEEERKAASWLDDARLSQGNRKLVGLVKKKGLGSRIQQDG